MSPQEKNFKDYFAILEISPFASPTILKAAYKALAKIYHPDSSKGPFPPFQDKTMSDINEAYEILSDPLRRADYWEKFVAHLTKKMDTKTLYFFQQWERDLKNREKNGGENSSEWEETNPLSSLVEDFFSLSRTRRHLFLEKIAKLPSLDREQFLEKIFSSMHLTGEKEREILFWILKTRQKEGIPFLERAFRFSDLYLWLLEYLEIFEISAYWNKVALIAKQLDIRLERHLELASRILRMNLPESFAAEMRSFIRREWKSPGFFSKKGKSPSYRKKLQEFQCSLKEFLSQNDMCKQNSN